MGIIIVYPWTAGRSTSQSERKSILNIIGKTDAETETLILWSPNAKNWFIGKDPDAGKDSRQEEKGITEDEMVGWHHQLLELAQTHAHQADDAIQPSHPLMSPSLLPSTFSSIRVFSNESVLCIRWPKYWNFSFSISLSNDIQDWFPLGLTV